MRRWAFNGDAREKDQMNQADEAMKQLWEGSFEEQIMQQAYNTAPVEAVVRAVSY